MSFDAGERAVREAGERTIRDAGERTVRNASGRTVLDASDRTALDAGDRAVRDAIPLSSMLRRFDRFDAYMSRGPDLTGMTAIVAAIPTGHRRCR